jgi:hypothetical protein
MPNRFAAGKKAIAECDVCGQRYKLVQLRKLVVKGKNINTLACPECWNPDHPQLMLGTFPVDDPQALRDPRPDTSYRQSGSLGEGSRVIQWGWAPVGLSNPLGLSGLENALVCTAHTGVVTIVIGS